MSKTPPSKNALLGRADVRIFQCQVRNSRMQERNIVVWQCGTNVLYSATMDGLFDIERRRAAPKWLTDQILNPPGYTVLFNYRGEKVQADLPTAAPELVAVQPDGGEDLELDEDAVAQG
jgi:hypothetical protein